ncbi:MAG: protease [Hyphomicrobiales bacterium]|nr:protease [Hyphomicrobiales bacterium]
MISGVAKTAFFIGLAAVLAASVLSDKTSAAKPSPQALRPQAPGKTGFAQPPLGYGRMELRPDNAGHYTANVEIDGRSLPMLVDTGATLVSLRYEDAVALGRRPGASDFNVPIGTANGTTRAASMTLAEVRIGTIRATDVQAIVLPPGAADRSLLGMSFLKKLGGFEIASGNLVLKP